MEIRQIDSEGRVGSDGRLRIGDRIVEINQRPVYQVLISPHHFASISQTLFIAKLGIVQRRRSLFHFQEYK